MTIFWKLHVLQRFRKKKTCLWFLISEAKGQDLLCGHYVSALKVKKEAFWFLSKSQKTLKL